MVCYVVIFVFMSAYVYPKLSSCRMGPGAATPNKQISPRKGLNPNVKKKKKKKKKN